ncbi:MAG: hypothetical protein P4M09_03095 [Devosia sp.]|nr:hypothetical protein [Devosia sp.]
MLPAISVRLAFHDHFAGLEEMRLCVVDCADKVVGLALNSPGGRASVLFGLDFGTERLELPGMGNFYRGRWLLRRCS